MSKRKPAKFIEARRPRDKTLQVLMRTFLLIENGVELTKEEAHLCFQICALALPMRYRFPREYGEMLAARARVWVAKQKGNDALEELKKEALAAVFADEEVKGPIQ